MSIDTETASILAKIQGDAYGAGRKLGYWLAQEELRSAIESAFNKLQWATGSPHFMPDGEPNEFTRAVYEIMDQLRDALKDGER